MHMATISNFKKLAAENAELNEKVDGLQDAVYRLRQERDEAAAYINRVQNGVDILREQCSVLDQLEKKEFPAHDWEARLKAYLALPFMGRGRDQTWKAKKEWLTPWVQWLVGHGGRATT